MIKTLNITVCPDIHPLSHSSLGDVSNTSTVSGRVIQSVLDHDEWGRWQLVTIDCCKEFLLRTRSPPGHPNTYALQVRLVSHPTRSIFTPSDSIIARLPSMLGADYSCSASPSMNCSHDSGDFIAVNNKALTGCPDNNGKTPHACPSPSFWRAVQACARFRSYAKIRRRRETEFVAHPLRSWDAYSEFVPVSDCGAKPLIAFWYQDRYS